MQMFACALSEHNFCPVSVMRQALPRQLGPPEELLASVSEGSPGEFKYILIQLDVLLFFHGGKQGLKTSF